jgi:outer membrane protein TolC
MWSERRYYPVDEFMKNFFCLILLSLAPSFATCQQAARMLSLESFLSQVKVRHPAARQAYLEREKAAQNVRQARGAFDPQLLFSYQKKDFRGKNYYDVLESELKLPTRLGLDFKAGYDRSSGIFLNPENNLPPGGLTYAGISMPLAQGLFIDEQRATLRQALIDAEAADLRQTALLNDLLLEASHVYWQWYAAWRERQIFQQALDLAQARFVATVETFRLGDRPAIDTLEALLQVQSRLIDLADAALLTRKAELALENFFWNENREPTPLQDSLVPAGSDGILTTTSLLESWQQSLADLPVLHPLLRQYTLKLDALQVERRWKKEKLKPRLDLQYNFLTEPVGDTFREDLGFANAKWGVYFKFPLFLRSERSGVQLTDLKIRETSLELAQKEQLIRTKTEAFATERQNFDVQLATLDNAVDNYRLLLQSEQQLFDLGESTVFLVNSRENKLVEAQVKRVTVEMKRQLSMVGLLHTLGSLASLF